MQRDVWVEARSNSWSGLWKCKQLPQRLYAGLWNTVDPPGQLNLPSHTHTLWLPTMESTYSECMQKTCIEIHGLETENECWMLCWIYTDKMLTEWILQRYWIHKENKHRYRIDRFPICSWGVRLPVRTVLSTVPSVPSLPVEYHGDGKYLWLLFSILLAFNVTFGKRT